MGLTQSSYRRKQGKPALSPAQHEELLELYKSGIKSVRLASMFQISIPTLYAWLKRPIGYKPKSGRPRKSTPGATQ